MTMRSGRFQCVAVAALTMAGLSMPAGLTAQSVVRAVLFFSPTCPHCHQVINEDLPIVFDRFGGPPRVWVDEAVPRDERAFYYVSNGQLEVLLVDASQPAGGVLYERVSQQFAVPQERMGVPRLVVGDSMLVGSVEIPTVFPQLILEARDAGGLDWPSISGLLEQIPSIPLLAADPAPPEPEGGAADSAATSGRNRGGQADTAVGVPTPGAEAVPDSSERDTAAPSEGADSLSTVPPQLVESALNVVPSEDGDVWTRLRRDPVGNGLAVVVFVAMILSVYVVFAQAPAWQARTSVSVLVPILCTAGMAVAAYLSYVETSGTAAVCGPVGDCNTVQQSAYAHLFGVPIGVLGLAGYAGILLTWVLGHGTGRFAAGSTVAQFAMVFLGVVFSAYLTFLEPFVIGATCLWCLSSALIMTALLWLVAGPGFGAVARLRGRG